MILKERIIKDFLADDNRNYTVYQTTFAELSQMYDKMVDSVKSKEKFSRFLNFEGAITVDGKVRFDREVTFYDKETKKEMTEKVVFKYPVYNYLESKYKEAMDNITKKNAETLPALDTTFDVSPQAVLESMNKEENQDFPF